MSRIAVPSRLQVDDVSGDWHEAREAVIGALGALQDNVVATVNGQLSTRDNTTSDYDSYLLGHGERARIKNPLSRGNQPLPVRGIWAVRCVGVEMSGGKPTRKLYSLEKPRIDWEPADSNFANLLVTATYPQVDDGESLEHTSNSSANVATATPTTIYTLTLTPGEWDVCAMLGAGRSTGTAVTGTTWRAAIGTTTASFTGTTKGKDIVTKDFASWPNSDSDMITIPPVRFSVAVSTPIYLVGEATFSAPAGSGVNFFGRLSATRVAPDPATTGNVTLFFFGG